MSSGLIYVCTAGIHVKELSSHALCDIFPTINWNFPIIISYTIVPYELSAEYIIVKLSAYSIRDDNRKIPIDCGKYHVKHDITVLLT